MTASHSPILDYDSSDEYRPEPVPPPQAPAWRDGSIRIGIHTSIADGFAGSLESAAKLGCNALQIFSASPRMWPHVGARISEIEAAEFCAKRAELGLGPLVIHANYLINLASSDPVLRVRSIQAYHDEMVRGAALGADYLVVHPGSCCGKTPGSGKSSEQGIRDVALAIRQAARGMRLCGAFDDPRDRRLRLLLENTSGMGMAVGSRFEELKAIIDAVPDLPLGICLDTAHAFHAGYGIHTEAGLSQTIAALERTVGLSRVAVLHVNDSKTPFGSRVDRHDHIGKGKIGLDGLRRVLNHPKLSASASRTGSVRNGSANRRSASEKQVCFLRASGKGVSAGNAHRRARRRPPQRAAVMGTRGRGGEASASSAEWFQHDEARARGRRRWQHALDVSELREPREARESHQARQAEPQGRGRIQGLSHRGRIQSPGSGSQVAGEMGRRRRVRGGRRSQPPEILSAGDAAVSLRHAAYGPHAQLHDWRRRGPLSPHARLQRAAPHRLGRVRPSGRKRGHQARARLRATGPTPISRR